MHASDSSTGLSATLTRGHAEWCDSGRRDRSEKPEDPRGHHRDLLSGTVSDVAQLLGEVAGGCLKEDGERSALFETDD